MTVLISAQDLHALIGSGSPVRVLDVRWRLDRPNGRPEFEAGHLPGAVFVDLGRELAGRGEPTDGRHPLPDPEAFQDAARSWGIDDGDTVVVYDDLGGMSAARAWWLLRHHGVEDVRILDGSLGAWRDAGLPLQSGPSSPRAGTVTLSAPAPGGTLDIDEAAALPAVGALLDARAGERYAGEVEPIDPRAGHIPGAMSAPTSENLGPDGRFLSVDALRERFAALGATSETEVGVYCGSGVTAAHTVAALAIAGIDARLFPGSWSAWSNHPDRPVATGPTP
ncbi:sulfurtransferase [Labedella endophytica]|uniref:Sulfurtransferase n=1 Tax=Labedella endophytica TaxID=1523160 RepID=A0A3S0WWI4_9MICO|nr:sulfurtransferase [Labedella endophytica]RUQ99133.1 sulfurtransferase [Labedella endophytica]